jgi:pheromone shutdown protein TraB
MKRVYLSVGALVVMLAVLFGSLAISNFASAQTNNPPGQSRQIVGSVKVPTRSQTLASLAKIDILKAIGAASAAQTGTVLGARLDERDGFLTYQIFILIADGNEVLATVDAGNGTVLSLVKLDRDGRGRDERGPGGK